MAMAYDDANLLEQAAQALTASDQTSEDAWRQLVEAVRVQFKKDERAVAAELQRLAKLLETARTTDDAITFKQRTCSTLMALGMEERHKNRPPPASAPPPAALQPLVNMEAMAVGTQDFHAALHFYRTALQAEVVWQKEAAKKQFALLKVAAGPRTILFQHEHNLCAPAYISRDKSFLESLTREHQIECQEIAWPQGRAHHCKTPAGGSFIICGPL
jgi:hypothetical protein